MIIESLELLNFRNYERECFIFDENTNVLYGDNAQGKTNLIEAIYMMSFAKSFRTRKDRETINFNRDYARIDAVISTTCRFFAMTSSMETSSYFFAAGFVFGSLS